MMSLIEETVHHSRRKLKLLRGLSHPDRSFLETARTGQLDRFYDCLFVLIVNDGTKTRPRMEGMNRFVGLIDTLEHVRDEVVNGKLAPQMLVHQFGDIRSTLESTKGSSFPHSTSHELKGTSGNLEGKKKNW